MFFFFNNEKMTALTLAKYILTRAKAQGRHVTNLKPQKILYYVQGYYLAKFDHPLFPDEIQAWKFGPVVPNVYYEFSIFGPDNLTISHEERIDNCEQDEIQLIDSVIEDKMRYSPSELVKATHSEAPWRKATNNGNITRPNTVIDTNDMKEYFKEVMRTEQ